MTTMSLSRKEKGIRDWYEDKDSVWMVWMEWIGNVSLEDGEMQYA